MISVEKESCKRKLVIEDSENQCYYCLWKLKLKLNGKKKVNYLKKIN